MAKLQKQEIIWDDNSCNVAWNVEMPAKLLDAFLFVRRSGHKPKQIIFTLQNSAAQASD